MSSLRFRSTISPFIAREMWETGVCSDDHEDFFAKIFNISESLKNSMILIIPADLTTYLHNNPRLKILLSSIEDDVQSNIFVLKKRVEPSCSETNVSSHFASGSEVTPEWAVHRKIVNIIFNRSIPVLFDTVIRLEKKAACGGCEDQSIFCTQPFDLKVHVPNTAESLKVFVKDNHDDLLNFIKGLSHPSISMIRYTAFLCAFFNNAPFDKIKEIGAIDCIPGFLNDLRSIDENNFKELCYCVFRAFSFPSSQDVSRIDTNFSVDYHPNKPNSIDGVFLSRLDIVALHRNGRGGSGTKRVLMGRKAGNRILLAYVDDHDFSDALVKSRVKSFLGKN